MGRTAAGSTVGTSFPKLWKGMGWNFEIKCRGWRWECCREETLREEGAEALVHISFLHLEGTSSTYVHHKDNRIPAVFLKWDLFVKASYQAPVPNPASFFAFLGSWWRETALLEGDSVAPEMDELLSKSASPHWLERRRLMLGSCSMPDCLAANIRWDGSYLVELYWVSTTDQYF